MRRHAFTRATGLWLLVHSRGMKLRHITLPVTDPETWAAWMSRTLGTPPSEQADTSVQVGWSVLTFTAAASPETDPDTGTADWGHHLAFTIPVGTVDNAADLVEEITGTPPLADDGDRIIDRGGSWESRSAYFTGPENSVLEFIEHADRPDTDGTDPAGPPGPTGSATGPFNLLGVAEVGLGVPDVAAAGDRILTDYDGSLPHGFGDPDRRIIAAYGDIDGAIVLARDDRPWYPTDHVLPATSPPEIDIG